LKLRILHKGLLLIFIPLLVQLLFFAQLFRLVNQFESLEREEENRVMFARIFDQLVMESGTTCTIIICKALGSNAYNPDPEAFKARMDKLFARLKPLAHLHEETLEEGQRLTQDSYNLYKEMRANLPSERGDSVAQLLALNKLRPKYIAVFNHALAVKQMAARESDDIGEAWQRNERKRASLKRQILIGAVADFAITVLLLIAFLWNITSRLKVLVSNASLLPTNKPFTERVSGNDELAMLDSVLHDASTELRNAKEHRKSLMEMVAHDLRSPLSSAKSTVETLLRPSVSSSPEESQALLARLRRSLVQLIAFVEDLLTIDRLESGKLELEVSLFKINSLVDDCFESQAPRASGRDIKLVREGEDLEVIADQARLTQVVMNLLTNAIKYSPDGGTVKVLTRYEKDTVKVSVIDEGKGVPNADQKTIFDKFVQSKNSNQKEGFGLGLAICKLIIEAHKGTIGVTSEPGEGSEFWFALPSDHDDQDQLSP